MGIAVFVVIVFVASFVAIIIGIENGTIVFENSKSKKNNNTDEISDAYSYIYEHTSSTHQEVERPFTPLDEYMIKYRSQHAKPIDDTNEAPKENETMNFKSIFDFLKVKEFKSKISQLEQALQKAQSMLTPEMQDAIKLQETKKSLEADISNLNLDKKGMTEYLSELKKDISQRQSQIVVLDEEILLQSFGLYTPTYDFANSDMYKDRLATIRKKQKGMVKNGSAVTGRSGWSINGDVRSGNRMIKDMQKLLLRAFNGECDEIIAKVKYNNYDASVKRIKTSCDAISKLGNMMGIAITNTYYNLKIDELKLALEYAMKKQEEKEALKEERARLREEAKIQKELEEERKKIEKEKLHYLNELERINKQLENANENEKEALLEKKAEVVEQLSEIDKSIEDINYRETNKRAGYVYIISNIGSFGENVYKIGMTRRSDPTERIDELSDASVPFNFDVHAMIFTPDAPGLEAALHKAFEDKKINAVNPRREFFNVTLDEIKDVISKNFDKTVEYVNIPQAEQYRMSQKIREAK